MRITGGPDAPTITDGPFAEGAEVAGGYYVFEVDNLDDALALARDIPAARYGAVEVWPMVEWIDPAKPLDGNTWLALLLEPREQVVTPGTPEWDTGVEKHVEFGAAASDRLNGGAALHQDRSRWDRGRIARGLDRYGWPPGRRAPICRRR